MPGAIRPTFAVLFYEPSCSRRTGGELQYPINVNHLGSEYPMTDKTPQEAKSVPEIFCLINPSAATEFSMRYKSRMTKIAVTNRAVQSKYISVKHEPILLTSRYSG
jgi:hypothetical protein